MPEVEWRCHDSCNTCENDQWYDYRNQQSCIHALNPLKTYSFTYNRWFMYAKRRIGPTNQSIVITFIKFVPPFMPMGIPAVSRIVSPVATPAFSIAMSRALAVSSSKVA